MLTISIASVLNGTPSGSSVTATINAQNDVLTGIISGTTFQDNNFNGVQDPGEPILANAIVYIGPTSTTSFNPTIDYFTFTAARRAGNFAFDGLTPRHLQRVPAGPAQHGADRSDRQTEPPSSQIPSGTYYFNVNTGTALATAITFGDATLTNPNFSLSSVEPDHRVQRRSVDAHLPALPDRLPSRSPP